MDNKRTSLWEKLIALYQKHKELVHYLIVGGITTLLNYAVYAAFFLLLKCNYLVANTIAFVVAVIFAYYANKHIVFQSKTVDKRDAMREAGSFVLMRVLSLGVDLGLMALLVEVLSVHALLAKIPVQVVIVLLNYVFSKLFIFKK